MTLPKGLVNKLGTQKKRTFDGLVENCSRRLKNKTRKGDEANKVLLNQVNYVLLPSASTRKT